MTGNFQLDPSVPGAAQANPLLDVQQNEYSKRKLPSNRRPLTIQTVRSGYDPSDTGSPAGKVNGPSGLVGDSLSQAQLMILTYGMGASLETSPRSPSPMPSWRPSTTRRTKDRKRSGTQGRRWPGLSPSPASLLWCRL